MAKDVLKFSILFVTTFVNSFSGAVAQTLKEKIFLSYSYAPSASQVSGNGQSGFTNRIELQVGPPPIALNKKIKWIHTLYGNVQQLNLNGFEGSLTKAPSSFSDLQYGSILIYQAAPKWSLFHSSRLVWRTEADTNISSDGFFYNGLLTANFNPDGEERLVYSFGLALANDFDHNTLIPIIGLTYYGKRYTVEVAYPRVNFLYKFNQRWEAGLTTLINGGIFKIKPLNFSDGEGVHYARVIDVSTGATFNYLISKKIVFNNWIGYAFVRQYDLLTKRFEGIQSTEFDLNGSVFFRSGFGIRL